MNCLAQLNQSRALLIRDREYWFLIVRLLRSQKLTHGQKILSDFMSNGIGAFSRDLED